MSLFSSFLSRPSYCSSRTLSPFLSKHSSLINGDPRLSLSFLSASPQGLNLDELCVRLQRKSVKSSVVVQDGAVVTKSSSHEELKDGLFSVPSQQADKLQQSLVAEKTSRQLVSRWSEPLVILPRRRYSQLNSHFTMKAVFLRYARSKMTDGELRDMVSKTLTCRIDKRANCGEKMEEFLKRCFYHTGQYDSQEQFVALDKKLKEHETMQVMHYLVR